LSCLLDLDAAEEAARDSGTSGFLSRWRRFDAAEEAGRNDGPTSDLASASAAFLTSSVRSSSPSLDAWSLTLSRSDMAQISGLDIRHRV
jgi:hypothetical protein